MIYSNIISARFIKRPNRFIAYCEIDNEVVIAHVRNTGRCRELLLPGAKVYLEVSDNPMRKTGYSLISVEKGSRLVNIDSTAPNKVLREALENGQLILPDFGAHTLIKSEKQFYDSRFDFYLESEENKAFVEVKGVTLEEEGIALFPDAPTERGVKHMRELIKSISEGYKAYIIFIVQMKNIKSFSPNIKTHAEFGKVLREAFDSGVNVLCYDCDVGTDYLTFGDDVLVVL